MIIMQIQNETVFLLCYKNKDTRELLLPPVLVEDDIIHEPLVNQILSLPNIKCYFVIGNYKELVNNKVYAVTKEQFTNHLSLSHMGEYIIDLLIDEVLKEVPEIVEWYKVFSINDCLPHFDYLIEERHKEALSLDTPPVEITKESIVLEWFRHDFKVLMGIAPKGNVKKRDLQRINDREIYGSLP